MGQTSSRPDGKKTSRATCDAIWPREGVARLLQDGDYYEHINGISYLIHKKIGSGEYSEVYEASRINHAGHVERYAIKVCKSRSLDRQKRMKEELRIMTKLGTCCSQLVRLHHYSEEMDDETGVLELKLVLDLCTGGSLRQRMKEGPQLDERAIRIIAMQLARALHFLHTRRILHCDVKPENILFVDPVGLSVKLSDFGVAKLSRDGKTPPICTGFNASDIYLAPEILSEEPYGTQADMWSLGVTLYHCLTGHLPFQQGTSLKMGVCQEIISGSFVRAALSSSQFPEHLSFDALRFIERLLRVNPNERLNVIEALNHRWLRKTDLEPRRPIPDAGGGGGDYLETGHSETPESSKVSTVDSQQTAAPHETLSCATYCRMQTTTASATANSNVMSSGFSSSQADWGQDKHPDQQYFSHLITLHAKPHGHQKRSRPSHAWDSPSKRCSFT